MTTPHLEAPEHSTASMGAVVAAGVVLVGLVVGAALGIGQVLDLVAWMFDRA
jgi:hypothetical protein